MFIRISKVTPRSVIWPFLLLSFASVFQALAQTTPLDADEGEGEEGELIRERAEWVFQQRAFPAKKLPEGALNRAFAEVQQAERAQTSRPKFSALKSVLAGDSELQATTSSLAGVVSSWVNIGPGPIDGSQNAATNTYDSSLRVSGRIAVILVDPTNPHRWLAGAAQGGIWVTENDGQSWSPKSDAMPSLALGAMAFAPGATNTVYAGTGESGGSDAYAGAGLLKSTDGGNTWSVVNDTSNSLIGRSFAEIRVSPSNANTLLAATAIGGYGKDSVLPGAFSSAGIMKSTNGGATWTQKLPATGGAEASDIEVDSSNFNNQFAALSLTYGETGTGVYRSSDAGETWQIINGPWTNTTNFPGGVGRIEMAISPADPNVLYVSIQDRVDPKTTPPNATNANDGSLLGIWKTINALAATPTWTQLPTPTGTLQMDYNHQLLVDPADSRVLYFGEVRALKYDGRPGATNIWTDITRNIHADQHAIAFAGNRLLYGNDGGIYYRDDRAEDVGTTDWISCNTNLAITQFYEGAIHPTDKNFAIGGAQDNGTSQFVGNYGWNFVGYGDGGASAISSSRPTTDWASSRYQLQILRTTSGAPTPDSFTRQETGITDNQAAGPNNRAPFIARLVKHPTLDDVFLGGTDNIWRCNNFFSGATPSWSQNSPDEGSGISAIAFAQNDATAKIYAYGTSGNANASPSVPSVLKITQQGGGASWTSIGGTLPNRYITNLAFDTNDANILYVALSGFDENTPGHSGHLFRTKNALSATPTWTDISPPVNLPNNTVVLDYSHPEIIYVGTDLGVWQGDTQSNGTVTWTHFGSAQGMPNVAVYDLKFQAPTRRLFAFTHGRSAFVADLFPANDNLESARLISGTAGRVVDTNINASIESGEPDHFPGTPERGQHSVWFYWTAPIGGQVTFDTVGSNFDTDIAVYQLGSGWNGLALPAVAADNNSGGSGTSKVSFQTTAGSIYFIAIDGSGPNDTGFYAFNWAISDSTPASVTIDTPAHLSTIKALTVISGTASDPSGIQNNEVSLNLYHVSSGQYWNGSAWTNTQSTITTSVDGSGNWVRNTGLPTAGNARTGQFLLNAFAHDGAGNLSQAQSGVNNISFTVDGNPPTVSIASPANQSTISALSYSFSGIANDDFGVNRVILFIRRNSDNSYWNGSGYVTDPLQANLNSIYSSSDHSWTCNTVLPAPGSSMPNGSYTFYAIAEDKAGNQTQTQSDVTVEIVFKWTGATLHDSNPNNDSSSWNAAANWSTNNVPGVNDIVQMDNGDTIDLGSDRTVRGLRLGGNTAFNNHTITITGGPGTSIWSGGTITSHLIIAPGAAMTIDTTGQPNLNSGAVLTNAGTITVIASNPNNQQQMLGHNSNLINQSGGRLEIARDGVLMLNIGVPPIITNQPGGVIVKTNAANGRGLVNWALDNNGTVGSDSGTLAFDQGSTSAGSAGTFNMSTASARVEFAGGTHILQAGARFTGPGRGSLTSGTLSLAGSATVGTGGQAAGGFEMSAGNMDGAGSLSMIGGGGSFVWSSGSILTAVNLGAGTTSTFDTTGQPNLNSGAVLTNAGTITVLASLPNNPQQILGHNSNLINQSGGRIQIARDGRSFLNIGVGPIITNQAGGVIVKTTAASGRGLIDWALDNNGTVGSDSGTLAFDLGSTAAGSIGVFNNSNAAARVEFAGGTHVLKTGARFTGPGRGSLTAGTLSLAGAATIGAAGSPAGGFEMSGGTMDGAGSLSMIGGGGGFFWSSGAITAALTLGAGTVSSFDTTGQPNLNSGAVLTNAGTITVIASNPNNQQQMLGHNSNVINQSGGRLEIARDGVLMLNIGITPIITNQPGGVIVKTNSGAGRSVINWVLDNNGTAGSDSGTLAFDQGSTAVGSAGVFNTASSPARVEFAGGTHILKAGARFTGPGRGSLTAGALSLAGAATVGAVGTPAGGFEMSGGSMTGAGSLSMIGGAGSFVWRGGDITTALTLGTGTVSSVDTAGGAGGPYLNSGAILTNAGTITVSASNPNNQQQLQGHNSNVINQSGGRIEIARDGTSLLNVGIPPIITNQAGGTIVKTGPATGRGVLDWVLDNNGTVESDSGTLAFDQGSTAAGSSGTFNMSTAATRVEFANGNHILKAGARFTGPGRGSLTAGTLTIAGAATIGTAGLPAGGFEMSGGNMDGAGSLSVIGGAGSFVWSGGSILTSVNLGAGTTSTFDTTGQPNLNSGATLDNSGTITISASNPNNPGQMLGNNSNLVNEPGGRIEIARDGSLMTNIGTVPIVTNYGVIAKINGLTSDFGSFALVERGTLSLVPNSVLHLGGTVTFDFPSQIMGGKVLFDSTPPTMQAPVTISAGSILELNGGGMNGAVDGNGNPLATINGPGTFSWKAGAISGKLNLGSLLNWQIDTSGNPGLSNATINHAGTALVSGTGYLSGTSSTLNIAAGGLFQINVSMILQNFGTVPMIMNAGTFKIGGPAAAVTSNWDFTQASSGKLDFEIGGTGAGAPPQYSRLIVNGTALLGGALSVTPANGFAPAEGSTFPVMTFGNRNGTGFASTVGLNIATGVKLIPALTSSSLTLNAVLTTFGDWRKTKFGADADNPLIAGPNADPDHDGIANALEFAFNLDPLAAGGGGLPTVGEIEDPTTHKRHLATSYRRRVNAIDGSYTVRLSNNLTGAWDDSGNQLEQVGSPTPTGDGVTELVTVRVATPMSSTSKQFLDVLVHVD